MKNIRWIPVGVIASGVLLLSGCVAVPGSYGYDSGYYSQPAYPAYYSEPAPVVVSPSVYLQGGTYYDRGYYNRGYYDGRPRGYDGRPRYDGPDRGPRPGIGPRPGNGGPVAGPRPAPPQVARPRILSPQENARRGFTPDGRQPE
jgi:hypothetical protein